MFPLFIAYKRAVISSTAFPGRSDLFPRSKKGKSSESDNPRDSEKTFFQFLMFSKDWGFVTS